MKIPFFKCNANGNTFIIILSYNNKFSDLLYSEKINFICKESIQDKVDGLIFLNIKVLSLSFNHTYEMIYYNNDGTWGKFCLNGLRCSALLLKQELNIDLFTISCNNISYDIKILENEMVEVELNRPIYILQDIKVFDLVGNAIDSGAKHFVIAYDKDWPNNNKLEKLSKKIRYNKELFPNGINIDFYKIINLQTIAIKTYERGIESMMKSCASGSYACAYDYCMRYNKKGIINVINDGGNAQIIFNDNYKKNKFLGIANIEYNSDLLLEN